MLALLELDEIDAQRGLNSETSTYSISVDSSDVAKAIMLLEQNGFPRSNYKSLGEVFKAEGFVTSPFEERARFLYAMNEELSRSISGIAGIYDARVHFVLPDTDPLSAENAEPRASVFIYHTSDFNVGAATRKIQLAVANSIENLSTENVVVMPFVADDQPFLARR